MHWKNGESPLMASFAVSPAPTIASSWQAVARQKPMPNPALNLAPFGRWTLRDRAAQRRLALLQGLPQEVQEFRF